MKSDSDLWQAFDRLVARQHPGVGQVRNKYDLFRWFSDPFCSGMFEDKEVALVIDDAQEILSSAHPSVAESFLGTMEHFREMQSRSVSDGTRCALKGVVLLSEVHVPSSSFAVVEAPTLTPDLIRGLLVDVGAGPDAEVGAALAACADGVFARTFGHAEHAAFCATALRNALQRDVAQRGALSARQVEGVCAAMWAGDLHVLMTRSCESMHRLEDSLLTDAASRRLLKEVLVSSVALSAPMDHPDRACVDALVSLGALREVEPSCFVVASPMVRSLVLQRVSATDKEAPRKVGRKAPYEFPMGSVLDVVGSIARDETFLIEVAARSRPDVCAAERSTAIFVAFYEHLRQRVANSLRSSRTAVRPEFIPWPLERSLSLAANADVDHAAYAKRMTYLAEADDDDYDDYDDDEVDDEVSDEDCDDEDGDENADKPDGGDRVPAAGPLQRVAKPSPFHDRFRVLLDVPCRTVIVIEQVRSSFFDVTPSDVATPTKILLEIASLPLRSASDGGSGSEGEPDFEQIRKMQTALSDHKRAGGAKEAWLLLFEPDEQRARTVERLLALEPEDASAPEVMTKVVVYSAPPSLTTLA